MPDLAQIRDSSGIIVIPTSSGPSLTREQNVEASTTSMSKTSDGEGLPNCSLRAAVKWLRSTRRRLETETGDAEDVRESSDLTERGVPEVGTETETGDAEDVRESSDLTERKGPETGTGRRLG